MYYSDYKKKNGYDRKSDNSRAQYGEQQGDSYYRSGDRYSNPSDDRSEQRNSYSSYDNDRNRYNTDDRYDNRHRSHGGYNDSRNYYESNSRGHDDRNIFERAGDRIKEGWNNMMRDDDHNNDYLKSRHNERQAGYDNGDRRNRSGRDDEYGYHHQNASYGYAGDNRSYNDNGYENRRDGYNNRRENRNSYYTSTDRDNDYYRGYSEFDRADDRRREDRWRGSFI